uniref:Saposin B-type domain-containing protein n=1 Tax=Rhabditophanes sp. KR3021 TaxID=114890 RepID=A0AC35U3P1_9BILA
MQFVAVLLSIFMLFGVVSAGMKCTLCKDAVNELESYINSHEGSADGAEAWVCDKVTDGVSILDSLCKELFKKELAAMIKGIEAKEPVEKICKDIDFC